MTDLSKLHLGKQTEYVSQYDPSLLTPIPRSLGRSELGIEAQAERFVGADLWTGFELSWLNTKGKPQVAIAEFVVPASSEAIVESKSFKLYLNSYNQTRFESWEQVAEHLTNDLSRCAGGEVNVKLLTQSEYCQQGVVELPGSCVDDLDVEIDFYQPNPDLLVMEQGGEPVEEQLHSHLLKSNCPVTGQPDWASVYVRYRGTRISHEGLLKYIVSFREQQDFHEQCVERMFTEILERCQPEQLDVYARYTRRGGLDINPWRSTHNAEPVSWRNWRGSDAAGRQALTSKKPAICGLLYECTQDNPVQRLAFLCMLQSRCRILERL